MPKTADKDTSDVVAFEAGAYVFRSGEDSRDVYIVQEGEVEILGAEGASLARLGPGEPFGELSALEQAPRECSVRAAAATKLLRIDADTFAALSKEPTVIVPMLRRLSRRLWGALKVAAPPKVAAPVELRNPRFVHKSGKEYPLRESGEAVVGRADPKSGFKPEIELTELDTGRTLSRKHARVLIKNGEVFVSEEPRVSNGTFVNGARLKAGVPQKIASGDQVHFGRVETVFKAD